MKNARDQFLMAVLQCGEMDLPILDDIHYDMADVLDQLDDEPIQNAGLNGLLRAVFDVGIIDIKDRLDDRIRELKELRDDNEKLTPEEIEALEVLPALDPDSDIEYETNCSASKVYFLEGVGEKYREYLPEAVESFEENTGFTITG